MARSKKSNTRRSGNPPGSLNWKSSASASAHESTGGSTPVELLQAENEALKQRIRQLEEERDTYRKVVYAWAREQFPPEDFRRMAAEKDGMPLRAFIDQLEA